MSDVKYPIGSWEIVKTTNGHGVYEKGWGFVAIHDTSCHAHWNEGQEKRRALIAAAPDLLEALKEAIETIKFLSTRDNSWGEQIVCEDLQAIVAKATGSQS